MSSLSNTKFKDKEFLVGHISSIMSFYHPHCIDWNCGIEINRLVPFSSEFRVRVPFEFALGRSTP